MVSKNNKNLYLRRSADRVSKYTIKKLSIGAASVLLSTTFFLGSSTSASASTDDQGSSSSAETTETTAASTISDSNVTLKSSKVTADDEASTSTTSTNDATESQSTPTSETTASTTSEAATTQANANASSSSTTSSTDSASASSTSEAVNENTQVENSKQAPTESNSTVSNNNNSAATSETASQASDAQSTASDAVASAATSVADSVASSEAETTASASATPTSAVAMLSASDTQTTHEVTVSDWAQLVSAMSNSNYQQINVEGTLTATGDGNIGSVGHTVTISGSDNAGINFGSNILTATGGSWNITFANLNVVTGNASGVVDLSKTTGENTVTFDNVTASGTSLYGGGGNTAVVISGDTTSTVDNAGKNNEANIHDASSVTVAKGASFTINRSSIGDGINLPDGSAVVVSDDAKLTINMNTNNATDKARYHNAGVFMNKGGSFTSGRNSVVTMNTSIGQAIAIGAGRPSSTDSDRFGGYGTNQSRYDGPSTVTLGTNSTFNFTGRDGIILGNNSTFTSGEYSTVHFQNKGRGVALDLANDSNIIISKHSNTLFESDGKTKTGGTPSGSYDGYNYIGVNERGNITIDEYATFRVILTNRGDNNWDDVISLDSRSSSSNAAFTSKKGAVIDIRDDNTNFYAELISFPLGNANSKIDIEDPLYVNFQRYSAGGAITGWMAGVGGDKIQNTSDKTTANLFYMGGNKGTIRMGGTDYIVYQDIKADGAQQIWLNVNEVTFKKNGFDNNPKNDNGANPDLSISGTGLVAGVAANDVKEDSDNANGHYGISSRRAAQQIWISHETTNQASGVHKNTIRYVDEDGNEIFPSVTQEVDMIRDMTLSFSDDDIEAIKEYAKTHSADEILNYLKDLYTVTKDSGWQIANAVNTTTAYDAVTTPVLEGYTAKIQSTNANGVKVGDDASTVQATLVIPEDAVVKDGKLTAEYMNNGYTGIPANYETVVVYTKEVKDQTVTVVYQDKTDNKVLATDTVSGKPGTNVDYSTADQIKTLEAQGYKLVTDGYPGTSTTFGDQPETYYVVFEHATEDQDVQKDIKETVHYVGAGDQTPADNVQTATWTKTVTVDKVTGETVKETEWTPNKTNYDEVKTPAVTGYVADKETVPSTAVTQDDIEVTVTYSPVQADAQKAVINYVDQDNDNSVLATDSVTGDSNEKINYSTADKIKELTAKGYELVSDGFPTDATFDDDSSVDQVYNVVFKHATQTVTPNDPQKPGDPINPDDPEGPKWPAGTDKDSVQKDVTETVHYVGAGDNTPADVVQNATWTRTVTVDKVTGEIVASTDWTPSKDNYDEVKTPVVDGYVADQASVPSTAVTQDNIEKTVTYTAVGKIVPVDPDGNKIPDVPTPDYKNDPDDPTKVVPNEPVPEIPGKTPETPTVTPNDPTKDTEVVYASQKAVINYIDQDNNDSILASDSVVGASDEKINYSTADQINALLAKGYELVSDGFPADATFDDDSSVDQVYNVVFKHATQTVTPNDPQKPGDPINPDDPEGPKWPAGTDKDSVQKDVTETVHYVGAGENTPADVVQNAIWTRTVTVDKVTGEIVASTDWTPSKDNYDEVKTPAVTGYEADKETVPSTPVTQENIEVTVTYTPVQADTQKAVINYIDQDNNDSVLATDTVTGDSNEKINYSTADQINALLAKGYELVSDGFPADATFDDDSSVDQVYNVVFKHATQTVTPNDPQKPGDPINPDDPEGPKWPAGTDKDSVQKDVTETVHYVGAGDNTPADVVQNAIWTRTVTVDKVTGEIVASTDWTPSKDNYDEVKTPVVDGYVADQASVPSTAVTQDNIEKTVTYTAVGKIVPVDPDGNKIPDVPTPDYKNDPDDPTKVVPNEPVPEIPGKTPETPTVTPNDPTKDTEVVYASQKAVINYIDQDNNDSVLATDTVTGDSNEKINYSTADQINALLAKGYELVSDGFPADATFDDDSSVDQVYTVVLKHATQTVTPNDPQKPGDPINPDDPEGPKWPAGTDKDSVQKDVTETVHYVGAGDNTPADVVQNATWTRTVTVDKVTGEIVSSTDWTPSKDNYDEVKTPVVDGYVADQASVPSTAVTQDNIEKTVTYTAVGKIVPVDPDGNKIPDVPTPDYKNDPDDPTKVVPNEPVPEVPGKTPETPTVTPNDPTKDTEVVYQANSQKAIINYIDQDSNYSVIKSDTVTGISNEKINYSTATELEELLNKGYVLVSDGFPADATFDDDQNTDQVFTVIVKHGEAPVGPNNPHEPGTPVNPNDPDGPKWPATDEYSKEYTSTVHFVDENGNKVFDDNVQTSTWTRTLIIDTVTGEIKNPDASWQSDKAQYDVVNVAVKDGYYADKSQVAAKDAVQADLEDTVVYKPLGKVVPVDPNGNEIPNVSQPQYNNDPTDPTKGGKTDVPDIPGYTPEVPSVTPENPGKDTPVVYVPVQNEQTAKIIYIDTTTGATLEMDSATGMPGTTIDYSTKDRIENLVNKGYVVVEDGFSEANDPVFDSDDNTDQVYYVRLEHATVPVGPDNPHEPGTPVNPNDPDGPKWPATDEYSKEYTSTVHFVDKNGNKLREDDVQTSTWTRTLIIDKVTGEVLNPNETWLANKDSYTDVKVPVIEGYVADKAVVLGQATQQQDLETMVTYSPIGVIVPVDENGNKIPGANTPQYKNDPNDPTKVVVTDTPNVPGYTTDTPSVLPNDATVDTPVVYKKVSEPVSEQSVQPAQPQPTSVTEVSQPQQASVAKSSAAPQVTKAQPETVLPQMGDSNEHNLAMLGVTMLASLFGLASFTKIKKKQ